MDVIIRILQKANAHSRFCLRIENPPYLQLVIEDTCRNGPRGLPCISVAHYASTEEGLVCRPEMLFEVRRQRFSLDLCPFYFRDDQEHIEGHAVFWTGRIVVVDSEFLKQQESCAAKWNDQLKKQGFEAAFRPRMWGSSHPYGTSS
jgi:Domain of unknown function (DUF6908)